MLQPRPILKLSMGQIRCLHSSNQWLQWCMLSGPFLVSRTGDEGWTYRWHKVLNYSLIRHHKGCWFILTAGRWSWKLKSAKECVTTHLPNQVALKMDGAQTIHRYSAMWGFVIFTWVEGRGDSVEAVAVTSCWTITSADLGVSSK